MKTNLRAVTCKCGTKIEAGKGQWNGQRFECSVCAPAYTETPASHYMPRGNGNFNEANIPDLEPETTTEYRQLNDVYNTETSESDRTVLAKDAEPNAIDDSICDRRYTECRYEVQTTSDKGYKMAMTFSRIVATTNFMRDAFRISEHEMSTFPNACESKLAYSKKLDKANTWMFFWTVKSK